MISKDELEAAGFKECKAGHHHGRMSRFYQKRVCDSHGTRYFIDLNEYDEVPGVLPRGLELDITYNDGAEFHPHTIWLKASVPETYSVADVERVAAELWRRLKPEHYEGG